MDVASHETEYQAQGFWHGFQFRYGEMTGIDRKNKLVFLAATYDEDGREITPVRSFKYDTLVIAIGCVGNAFNTPGVMEHAIMLDTPEEAERFNRRLINACVRAFAQNAPIRPGQLHVAIIGAGATGTELAAELHQTARGARRLRARQDRPGEGHQDHADRGRRPHPAGAARAHRQGGRRPPARSQGRDQNRLAGDRGHGQRRQAAERRLHSVRARRVGGGRQRPRGAVEARRAGGQPRRPARRHRDAADDARSQHLRHGRLRLSGARRASAPIPPRAQAAHQEASHLYTELQRRMRGEPLRPFHYRDFGSLVSLGDYRRSAA